MIITNVLMQSLKENDWVMLFFMGDAKRSLSIYMKFQRVEMNITLALPFRDRQFIWQ